MWDKNSFGPKILVEQQQQSQTYLKYKGLWTHFFPTTIFPIEHFFKFNTFLEIFPANLFFGDFVSLISLSC